MSKYRSGPVPKALKVVPIISYWKECLSIMDPLNWSAASLKKVSKYFVASAKPHVCFEFFSKILLPRARDDISEYDRLNFHIFNALCIATHKPSVFFRAIVFPLCLDKDCCLKEAVIFSSILSRCSFPAIHAAVAIAKIASFPHSTCSSIFIKIFLQKRYAMPNRALDILLDHFLREKNNSSLLPLIWHQGLLIFVQNYTNYFNELKKKGNFRINQISTSLLYFTHYFFASYELCFSWDYFVKIIT
uniref:Cell adhesion protein byn-1 (Trinotate prediction) n=1 Tax=Myxobolus squamalis TaxID=59785 RepID=A0A6B2FYH1_MYXSQ